jgi:hypothetical protein
MGVRFGQKVLQPAETTLLHETAKFIAYAESLAETSRYNSGKRATRKSYQLAGRVRTDKRASSERSIAGEKPTRVER